MPFATITVYTLRSTGGGLFSGGGADLLSVAEYESAACWGAALLGLTPTPGWKSERMGRLPSRGAGSLLAGAGTDFAGEIAAAELPTLDAGKLIL